MARVRVPLNNFVFGEISPSLTSRVDSAIYNQSGQSVKNVFIRAEGGVINRPGSKRLHNFSQSYSQPSATITVSDFANIAVGTQLTFVLSDETKVTLEFELATFDIPIGSISGAYVEGETVTGGTSSATGIYISNTSLKMIVKTITGTFQSGETLTGGTSSATSTFFGTLTSSSASAAVGNKHFVRADLSNNATADNIFTALNAVTGLTSTNPAAAVVTVTRDGFSIKNLSVTTSDPTRLTVTDFTIVKQKIRLEPFVFSDDEKYVCAFSSGKIEIFRINEDGSFNSLSATITQDTASASLPFTDSNLQEFTYAQSGDFMFIAHNDFMIRELVRTGLTAFEVRTFTFDTDADGNKKLQPYYNFHSSGVTITPSAVSGNGITLTSSASYFVSGHVGVSLLINDTQVDITAVADGTSATANVQGTIARKLDFDSLNTTEGSNKVRVIHLNHGLASGVTVTISGAGSLGGISNSNINGSRTVSSVIDKNTFEYTAGGSATSTATGGGTPTISSTAATTEWFEQSYSDLRGYPAAVTFHENRLWFGGTPSQPSGIWGSVSDEYFNFDVGEGETADAIDIEVAVGVTNSIRHLVSNRDLQVFCNQGEFFLPAFQDQPITAAIAKVSEQTPFGSSFVRPVSLDGGTLFVQATGTAVREYIFNDSEAAYTTNMISILSSHLISNPIQLTNVKGSLDRPGAYAFFLMDTGEIAVFYSIRSEKRAGWMRWTREGAFHSVCAVDESLFAVTVRDDGSGTNKFFLEQFDQNLNMDFSDTFDGSGGVFSVSSHFSNGAVVDVVDDTEYLGTFTVSGGNVDVSAVKSSVRTQIGYKFLPELRTNAIDVVNAPGGPITGRPRKITNVILDLEKTLSISVNNTNMIIRDVTFDPSTPREAFTGKKEFRVLGYSRDPAVTISQIAPLNMQLNGMIVEVAF